jgi:hypothetical protein
VHPNEVAESDGMLRQFLGARANLNSRHHQKQKTATQNGAIHRGPSADFNMSCLCYARSFG